MKTGLIVLGVIILIVIGGIGWAIGINNQLVSQEQVVNDFHWLTPQQFLGGLALGQLTPGPVLMLAAYVGYTVAGVAGKGEIARTHHFLTVCHFSHPLARKRQAGQVPQPYPQGWRVVRSGV